MSPHPGCDFNGQDKPSATKGWIERHIIETPWLVPMVAIPQAVMMSLALCFLREHIHNPPLVILAGTIVILVSCGLWVGVFLGKLVSQHYENKRLRVMVYMSTGVTP